MLCTAGYSVWTKYSFKMPVLAGAVTCLLSNVLYISAYQTRSLWLLVLSRFVLGFGAPLNPACLESDQSCPYEYAQLTSLQRHLLFLTLPAQLEVAEVISCHGTLDVCQPILLMLRKRFSPQAHPGQSAGST